MERIEGMKINIGEILGKGGFVPKGFVVSGDQSAEKKSLLYLDQVTSVVCSEYHGIHLTDQIAVSVEINISKKYKGERVDPDLTYDEIPRLYRSN